MAKGLGFGAQNAQGSNLGFRSGERHYSSDSRLPLLENEEGEVAGTLSDSERAATAGSFPGVSAYGCQVRGSPALVPPGGTCPPAAAKPWAPGTVSGVARKLTRLSREDQAC